MRKIITPENNFGQDWVVGKHFAGYCHKANKIVVYFCDSYDTGLGYWLTNRLDASDRKNVSERAINNQFWLAIEEGDYFWCQQWGRKVAMDGTNLPRYGEHGWTPRVRKDD